MLYDLFKFTFAMMAGHTFTQKRCVSNVLTGDVCFNRMLEHAPIKHDKPSKCAVHSRRVDTMYACGVCKVRMRPLSCFHHCHYILFSRLVQMKGISTEISWRRRTGPDQLSSGSPAVIPTGANRSDG